MTAREMHIEIDIRAQRIFSEAYDTFLPEEKDWLFNTAQMQLIKTRSSAKSNRRQEGYETVVKRYDDLQALLTRVTLPCFLVEDTDNVVYSILPDNYLFYDKVTTNNKVNCSNLIVIQVPATLFFTGKAAFPQLSVVPNNPYKDFKIEIKDIFNNWILLFNINNYVPFSTSLTDAELKFALINLVLEEVNKRTDVKIRWQTLGNLYNKGYFVLESSKGTLSDSYYSNIRITIDGNEVIQPISTFDAKQINVTNTFFKNRVPSRLINTNDIADVNIHPFAKTVFSSPTNTLESNCIRIYNDSTFTTESIELAYIRKPRKISLALEQDCELAEETHTEIVGIATQLLSGFINADNYKNIINENLLNE